MKIENPKVLTFGPTGVGKTSLLAVMWEAVSQGKLPGFTMQPVDTTVIPDASHHFHGILSSLRQMAIKPESCEMPSTGADRRYTFNVGHGVMPRGKVLQVDFIDIPGEWFIETKRKKQLIELIESAQIIVVAISMPAILENDGIFNTNINKSCYVSDFFSSLVNCHYTKLVLLVPLKCEKYMEDFNMLQKELRKHYSQILEYGTTGNHIVGWIPVETIGSIVFDRFEDGYRKEVYKRKSSTAGWEPKNADALIAEILHYYSQVLIGSDSEVYKVKNRLLAELERAMRTRHFNFPKTAIYPELSCFSSDTKILMADCSSKNICDIQQGEQVMSWNPITMTLEPCSVKKVTKHTKCKLFNIRLGSDEIKVTRNHFLYSGGGWVRVKNLRKGHRISRIDESCRHLVQDNVSEISPIPVKQTTFNLYTSKNSNFFANGVLSESHSVLRALRTWIERTSVRYRVTLDARLFDIKQLRGEEAKWQVKT